MAISGNAEIAEGILLKTDDRNLRLSALHAHPVKGKHILLEKDGGVSNVENVQRSHFEDSKRLMLVKDQIAHTVRDQTQESME